MYNVIELIAMTIQSKLLQSTKYFEGIETVQIDSILPYFKELHLEKGAQFISEGSRSDALYFIVSGLVKVYKTSSNGKEQVLHIAPPGDSLNDVSLFDGEPNAAGMATLTPVVLYSIKKDDIFKVLRENPAIMMNVIKALASRIRRDSKLLEDISSSQVLGRLAKLFLGRYGGEELTAGLNLTQKDLASLVGSSREMVNRSLKVIEDMGGIRLSRRKVFVLDKDILQNIAEGNPDGG
jgi:CRP/FNR family transcriptional regulator, cyclic AMP receptor protein